MSANDRLMELRGQIAARTAPPHLLTVSDDGRPHTVGVEIRWQGDMLAMNTGRRSAANAAARPRVSLLWPAAHPGAYDLIVDGEAQVTGTTVMVVPGRGVLHRAGPPPAASACGSDCVPLFEGKGGMSA